MPTNVNQNKDGKNDIPASIVGLPSETDTLLSTIHFKEGVNVLVYYPLIKQGEVIDKVC
jgi:hypothetical protein